MSHPRDIALRNALSGAINNWSALEGAPGEKPPQGMVILGALADITAELIGQAPEKHRGQLLTAFVEALGERLGLTVTAVHSTEPPTDKSN